MIPTVSPNGDIGLSFVTSGEYLDYTIRFQNAGIDTASIVVLRDTLSNNLDISSFVMLPASHNYALKIVGSNKLEWTFNNILLPDSNHNELKSHGFVRFRFKTNKSLVVGDQVFNKASIYFDFNTDVVTNQTVNTVVSSTVPVGQLDFNGKLSGMHTLLFWHTENEQNSAYFEIEPRTTSSFVSIGTVAAKGENHGVAIARIVNNIVVQLKYKAV